jgi:hypothetical protein|tara:strand:+ start:261 stop:662 length:402 start_codon:yes stop_codon:yes gene_type:complete
LEDLIKYRKRFNQPIVFNGLQDGVISPTDIDFVFEVDNKFLLIGECKVEGKDLTVGQKLVLQRLVDNWTAAGKLAIAYYVTHNFHPDDDVVLSECDVHSVYTSGQWQRKNIKFRDSLMKLAKHWDIGKLKNLK